MPIAAELIRKAAEQERKSWRRFTVHQEERLWNILDNGMKRLSATILAHTQEGKIPPERLILLRKEIAAEMALLRPALTGQIQRGMSQSVNMGVTAGVSQTKAAGLIVSDVLPAAVWSRINNEALDALIRYSPTGTTLSERVWDLSWSAEKDIRNEVANSVLLGESADKLSRRIRNYLEIPETFRGDVLSTYKSGQGVYRSAYKNAMRLARTEMNRAFSEGTIRYGLELNWIDGWIWRTGGLSPCEICEPNDGQFFPKDEPPSIPAHSNCLCFLELHFRDETVTPETPANPEEGE